MTEDTRAEGRRTLSESGRQVRAAQGVPRLSQNMGLGDVRRPRRVAALCASAWFQMALTRLIAPTSREAVRADRERSHALTDRRKDCIAHRRGDRRHAGLSNATGRGIARH
jgi:hypothetical protein